MSENPTFDSTFAAFTPAAEFIASMIGELRAKNGDDILPGKVKMLNVNFPVPYQDIQGVALTDLADGSDLELPLFDPSQGFPPFLDPLPFPSCVDAATLGGACFAGVGFMPSPDESTKTDLGAFREGHISITPMSGDMSVNGGGLGYLKKLDP